MDKFEPFDAKQTNWEGLWWHPEYCGFSSASISLSKLKQFKGNVRLYVRKNKYFNGGENGQPNYCFCIKDSKSDVFHSMEIEDYTDTISKVRELAEIMRAGNTNGDVALLPSESVSRANQLRKEAIDKIEEITGEKWDFSYITY